MPVNVVWHDTEKTIMRVYFDGPWKWDDVYGTPNQTNRLAEDVSGKFHMIVEMYNISSIPRGMSIRKLIETSKQKHPNTGMTVISGINPTIKPVVNTILSAAFFGNFRFAVNTEEAVRLIETYKTKNPSTT